MLSVIAGCSSSITHNVPSGYDRSRLCDRYRDFVATALSMTDASVDDPVGTAEGGVVGWSTICHGRHGGRMLIGSLQVHSPQIDGALELPSYLQPLAGFDGKAWTGAPLTYWTEVYVQDGTWSAAMSFVKDTPEQELLDHAAVQKVAAFLVEVARDLHG